MSPSPPPAVATDSLSSTEVWAIIALGILVAFLILWVVDRLGR